MHESGFRHLLVNEVEHRACETLRLNAAIDADEERTSVAETSERWPLIEKKRDVHKLDFSPYQGQVDVVAGGVPASRGAWVARTKGPTMNGICGPNCLSASVR